MWKWTQYIGHQKRHSKITNENNENHTISPQSSPSRTNVSDTSQRILHAPHESFHLTCGACTFFFFLYSLLLSYISFLVERSDWSQPNTTLVEVGTLDILLQYHFPHIYNLCLCACRSITNHHPCMHLWGSRTRGGGVISGGSQNST